MVKKVLSVFLAFIMVVGMLPATAFTALAADGEARNVSVPNVWLDFLNDGIFDSADDIPCENLSEAIEKHDAEASDYCFVIAGGTHTIAEGVPEMLSILDGTVTIESGTFKHNVYASGGTLKVNGGSFAGFFSVEGSSHVEIADGTISEGLMLWGGSTYVSGGVIKYLQIVNEPVDLTFTGGTFHMFTDNPEAYIADGYTCQTIDDMYVVEKIPAEAVWGTDVDDLPYEGTLTEALAAAKADPSIIYIKLMRDLSPSTGYCIDGGSFTLDLNGYTIQYGGYVLTVTSGTVILEDSSSKGSGTLSCTKSGTSAIVLSGTDIDFTINGGTYESGGSVIFVGDQNVNADLTINNGTFHASGVSPVLSFDGNSQLTINGGHFQADHFYALVLRTGSTYETTAKINGGTYTANYEDIQYRGGQLDLSEMPESLWVGLTIELAELPDGENSFVLPENAVLLNNNDEPATTLSKGQEYTLAASLIVNFAAGKGTGAMEAIGLLSGQKLTLPECTFTAPEGMKFAGWQLGDKTYTAGASVTLNKDTTFTALWEKIIEAEWYLKDTKVDDGLLSMAIAAAEAGTADKIVILSDLSGETMKYDINGGSFTIDLNGHSLVKSSSGDAIFEISYAEVTFIDSSADSSGCVGSLEYATNAVSVESEATVTIEGGIWYGGVYPFCVDFGNLLISGGTVKGNSACVHILAFSTDYIAELTVTGSPILKEGALGHVCYELGSGAAVSVDLSNYTCADGMVLTYISDGTAAALPVLPDGMALTVYDEEAERYKIYEGETLSENEYIVASLCTVSFAAGEGVGEMADAAAIKGEYFVLPECTFTAPVEQVFLGWEVDGKRHLAGEQISIKEDTTITALWGEAFSVTFKLDDETSVERLAVEGAPFILPDFDTFVFQRPEGKRFKAWLVDDGEIAREILAGRELFVESDLTVTPIWRELPVCTVTLEGLDTETVYAGSSFTLPECTLAVPEGVVFLGWYIAGEFYEVNDTITVNASITAEAVWGIERPDDFVPEIYVGGVGMDNDEYLGNDGIIYRTAPEVGYAHFESGVLTLHDYEYTGKGWLYDEEYDYYAVICSEASDGLQLVLEGENTLIQTMYDSEVIHAASLTIDAEGAGALAIKGDCGIYTYEGSTTIRGGAITVEAAVYAIAVNCGDLTIRGGTVDIVSDETGIAAWPVFDSETDETTYGNAIIQGGILSIDAEVFGMQVENMKMTAGEVTITGGKAMSGGLFISAADSRMSSAPSAGICAEGAIMISGGALTIETQLYGIQAPVLVIGNLPEDLSTLSFAHPGPNVRVSGGMVGVDVMKLMVLKGAFSAEGSYSALELGFGYEDGLVLGEGVQSIRSDETAVVIREGSCEFAEGYSFDLIHHWKPCMDPNCELFTEYEEHNFEADNKCEVCGFEKQTGEYDLHVGIYGLEDGAYLLNNGSIVLNETLVPEEGYAHFEDGVLTLNNFSYRGTGYRFMERVSGEESTHYTHASIYSTGDLKLVLVGENTIENTFGSGNSGDMGIAIAVSDGNLTVLGSGALDIAGMVGMYLMPSDITEGASETDLLSEMSPAVLTIENGNISICADGMIGIGIAVMGDVVIKDGSLDIDVTNGMLGQGINTQMGDIVIQGGDLDITTMGMSSSNGITAVYGNVRIAGGTIQVKSAGCGISADYGDITIYDGTIDIEASSNGIYAYYGNITISDGNMNVLSDLAVEASGIYAEEGDLIITGGDITASGGECGLLAYSEDDYSDIFIKGGTIDIYGYYQGIYAEGVLSISGKNTFVTASCEEEEGFYALYAYDEIQIENPLKILSPEGCFTEDGYIYDSEYNDVFAVVIGVSDPSSMTSTIFVGGVELEDGDYLASGTYVTAEKAPEEGGYAYFKDGILTLNDYTYEGVGCADIEYEDDMLFCAAVYAPSKLTVRLVGENRLMNTGRADYYCEGILAPDGLTVEGTGTLAIACDTDGIGVFNGMLTVNGGVLEIETGEYAILAKDLVVNAGKLKLCGDICALYIQNSPILAGNVAVIDPEDGEIAQSDGIYSVLDSDGDPVEQAELASTYTVTFVVDGEFYAKLDVLCGEEIEAPAYTAPEGYIFSGWDVPETMPAEDLIVEAELYIDYTVENGKLTVNPVHADLTLMIAGYNGGQMVAVQMVEHIDDSIAIDSKVLNCSSVRIFFLTKTTFAPVCASETLK